MHLSHLIALSNLAAIVAATTTQILSVPAPTIATNHSTTAVAPASSSLSLISSCLLGCQSSDVSCNLNPCPTTSSKNATTACPASCPGGNSTQLGITSSSLSTTGFTSNTFTSSSESSAAASSTYSTTTVEVPASSGSVVTTSAGTSGPLSMSVEHSVASATPSGACNRLEVGAIPGAGLFGLIIMGVAL